MRTLTRLLLSSSLVVAALPAQAACPDQAFGYTHQTPVLVKNPGAATGTFMALLTLDTAAMITAGQLKPDGSDLFFTDEACGALPFWVQDGLNTATTNVWVRLPTLAPGPQTLRLFSGAPAAARVNQASDVFGAGLVGLWVFTEQSGTTVFDRSGATNLTATGLTWGAGPRPTIGALSGFTNGASGNRLQSPAGAVALGAGDFSVAVLVNPDTAGVSGSVRGLIGTYTNDGASGWALKMQGGAGKFMLITNQGGNWCQAQGGSVVANKWHLLGARRKAGATNTLFQNGLPVANICPNDTRNVDNAGAPLDVGRGYNGSFSFTGSGVAFAAIYNRALSDQEFAALGTSLAPADMPTVTVGSTVADAPTITSSTAGMGSVRVSFTAPAFTGLLPVTGYTLTCVPGGSVSGPDSPLTLAGVPDGVSQSCRVVATNANGDGVPSAAVTLVPGTSSSITSAATLRFVVGTPGTFTFSATGSPAPALSIAGALPSGVTFSGSTLSGTADPQTVGSYPLQLSASNGVGSPASQAIVLEVLPSTQTITFEAIASHALGSPAFDVAATSSATLAVSLASLTPSICTVAGTQVTLLAAGTCVVQATQPGDAAHVAAEPVIRTFDVTVAAQTLTFDPIADHQLGASPFDVAVSSSVGLPVTLASLTPTVCSLTGTQVTMLTGGTCVLQAAQPGDAAHAAAEPVIRAFEVTIDSQSLTFDLIDDRPLGSAPFAITASSTAGLPVLVASLTPTVCAIDGVMVTLLSSGVCVLQATQAGAPGHAPAGPIARSFKVTTSTQTITFAAIDDQLFGAAPLALALTASSGLPVTLTPLTLSTCSVEALTVTPRAIGTCALQASQAGDASHPAAEPVVRTFHIGGRRPSAPTVGTVTPGDSSATVELAAPSDTGGCAIAFYTVTCDPGGRSTLASAGPITIPQLKNQTAYSCSLTATNCAGASPAATFTVTPVGSGGCSCGSGPESLMLWAFALLGRRALRRKQER
jgi:MYXO-CTERM domain-containing protein